MPPEAAATRQPVAGVLVIDKPAGWTSHDVVARVRRVTGQRRVGHAGTLDPAATGVLVVCTGTATRLVEYLSGMDKAYTATVRLGVETDTWDADGEVVSRADTTGVTRDRVERVLEGWRGEIDQVPPMYSALKRDGKPLYRLARQGTTVELEPRRVTIYRLELRDWSPPEFTLDVVCSKGTYVRSLAHDLGAALGTGAHLAALRRTRVGPFALDSAVHLDALEPGSWQAALVPLARALAHMPSVTLDAGALAEIGFGRPVHLPDVTAPDGDLVALDTDGRLAAILRPGDSPGWWRPAKVLRSPD